jgi:kynurenine formamidase
MRTETFVACLVALTLVGCRQPPPEREEPTNAVVDIFEGKSGRWVDLTYEFSSETIYWPTGKPFELEEVAYGISENGYFYSMYNYAAGEHGGTHFDAPSHFAEDSDTSEKVPLDSLIGPAVVVDVTDKVTPDYQIEVADIERWEEAHGWIPDGAIVLFRTGWGSRWPDRKSFLGTDKLGEEAVAELHFPGISTDAALFLARERRIDAIGIDTPSIDYGQSTMFETHQILYGANIPGFENVAHLDQLPEAGGFIVALPMKIAGGSGGPLRIVAFVPNEGKE